jgi:hypothetical protein
MHQLLRAIVVISIWGKQARRSINGFDRNFERARNGRECGWLWFALSIEEFVDDRSI